MQKYKELKFLHNK